MPKFPTGGKVRVSLTPPPLNLQKNSLETEVKYYGLIRDEALFDIENPSEALSEVLKDIQDSAEASTEGIFDQRDLEIIDGIIRYGLKNEDFNILLNASLNVEDDAGASTTLVNPRQRIADRIKQLEFFAGRGTVYQGQGTVLFKYIVPKDAVDGSSNLYSHTNPPPFFTEDIDSTAENSADFVPSTTAEIENTHRVGFIENGIFVPSKELEYWWSGAYNHEARGRVEYGSISRDALSDPKYPIVRDGNLSFEIPPEGISVADNWGLRFDTWMKLDDVTRDFGRFAAQVSGHLRIDFFERTGYDSSGNITGSWKTALDTTDPNTYFIQESREESISNSTYGHRRYFIQGGPSVDYAEGTGTKPDYATRAGEGGVFDFSETYLDRENNTVSKYDNTYVPVVIRFWYGQKDPSLITASSTSEEILESAPVGPPSIVLDYTQADGYANWNDYSSIVKFAWNNDESAWVIQSNGNDTDLSNFNDTFEVYAYKQVEDDPDGGEDFDIDHWDIPSGYIGGSRVDGTSDEAIFAVPGITPSLTGYPMWAIIRNRPWSGIPTLYNDTRNELWQRYLFDPSARGEYETAQDLLEGIGTNYIEPDPARISFDESFDFYKYKFGQLPALDTYGPDRYDGMIRTELTSQAGQRDYDYDHSKLLFIGRQKKGTVSEIGDGIANPNKVGKDLATGETRDKGENYTFINVISDEAGNGGNIIINAFPVNSMGILGAGNTGTFDKALNLADNTQTYNNSSRQNITKLAVKSLPATGLFPASLAAKVEESPEDGAIYVYQTSLDGGTYNTTGIISQSDLGNGSGIRNHNIKNVFWTGFELTNSSKYYFYGLVGAIRPSLQNVNLTTSSSVTTKAIDSLLFPNIIGVNSYQGTLIEFKNSNGGSIVAIARITAYDPTTNEITYEFDSGSDSIASGTTYFVDIWFNFFKLPSFPDNVVNDSGDKIITSSVLADNSLVKFLYVYNGSYQYSRVDNGSGLSFSETLFVIGDDSSTTESSPFLSGTEAPAPPAEIVTPFGYDNSVLATDPGLGGLCYPPYSTQAIDLIDTVKSTTQLSAEDEGNFDVWWGSRDDLNTLGNKYLEVTNKLLFDFDSAQRSSLLNALTSAQKPDFIGASTTPYTHKLEIELNVELPTAPATNQYLYEDVKKHSNNKPVKDLYYLFINESGSNLEVLTANNPNW